MGKEYTWVNWSDGVAHGALRRRCTSRFEAMKQTVRSSRFPSTHRTWRNPPRCSSARATTRLQEGIARFYDASSALWEDMWGEHMHHGYYPDGKVDQVDHKQAQVDMVERVLKWADVKNVQKMVDVGCGIGGSSRHVVRKYPGSTATGISLSPKQVERANQITKEANLDANFQVADALQQPFEDGSFDLVWSLESGEHMPDKKQFVQELARVCAPGGTIIVVTWCHRVLQERESLKAEEESLLKRICDAYYLPAWCSIKDYEDLMQEQGLASIKVDDWSEFVAPFWGAVIQTALQPRGIIGLFSSGWETLRGALVMPLMAQGFRMGLIKFNLITARKPRP